MLKKHNCTSNKRSRSSENAETALTVTLPTATTVRLPRIKTNLLLTLHLRQMNEYFLQCCLRYLKLENQSLLHKSVVENSENLGKYETLFRELETNLQLLRKCLFLKINEFFLNLTPNGRKFLG